MAPVRPAVFPEHNTDLSLVGEVKPIHRRPRHGIGDRGNADNRVLLQCKPLGTGSRLVLGVGLSAQLAAQLALKPCGGGIDKLNQGGVLLGVVETFAKAYISTALSDAVVFAVLIIVLLVKPAGLMGKYVPEKV